MLFCYVLCLLLFSAVFITIYKYLCYTVSKRLLIDSVQQKRKMKRKRSRNFYVLLIFCCFGIDLSRHSLRGHLKCVRVCTCAHVYVCMYLCWSCFHPIKYVIFGSSASALEPTIVKVNCCCVEMESQLLLLAFGSV